MLCVPTLTCMKCVCRLAMGRTQQNRQRLSVYAWTMHVSLRGCKTALNSNQGRCIAILALNANI